MNKKLLPIFLLATMATGLTGCAQRNDDMEAQILQHDAEIRRMQPAQADTRNELQSIREELREMRGLVADLKRAGGAAAMVDKLNRHDAALRQIETSMAMKFDLGDPIQPAAGAPVVAQPVQTAPQAAPQATTPPVDFSYGGLNDNAGAGAAAGAATGAATGAAAASAASAAAAPSGSTWGQETPRPKQPVAQKDMKIALYEAGVNAYNSRKYTEAQRSFSDYLQNFGQSGDAKTTASAQYYLGECYFQTNQFADAALAYDTVINSYSKSDKAPAAYLKQGICFSKMKKGAAAKARMNELIKKYPNSPEAKRAKDFLKTNK